MASGQPDNPITPANDPILEVRDLVVEFASDEGDVTAVNGVSFSLERGRTLGIVGESGCGKSVTAYAILRLIQKPGRIRAGSIRLHPKGKPDIDVLSLKPNSKALKMVRGGLASMIFQEPMTALSPVHTIGNQIVEAIRMHQSTSSAQAMRTAVEMLGLVGIPAPQRRVSQYPFELSGGMRQRAMIAMALACRPQLLIADEPTTALDVTIQAQIMRLIRRVREEMGLSTILITHDVGVVGQMCDDVAVMYLGRIVERGPVRRIIREPRHPYTQLLLASLPSLSRRGERLPSIRGNVPSLYAMPSGCPFHPRCPHAQAGLCDVGAPPDETPVGEAHTAACVRVNEIAAERATIANPGAPS